MKVTLYKLPDGIREEIDIKNVLPEDEEYFTRNGIHISMESIGQEFVVYADIGGADPESEMDEVLVLSKGRSCEETLAELVDQCRLVIEGSGESDDTLN